MPSVCFLKVMQTYLTVHLWQFKYPQTCIAAWEFLRLFPVTISLPTHPLFLSTSLPYPPFLVVSSAKDCHSCLRVLGTATSMCPHDLNTCLRSSCMIPCWMNYLPSFRSLSVFPPVEVSWHVSSFFATQVATAVHWCESLPWILPSGANVYIWDANKIQR